MVSFDAVVREQGEGGAHAGAVRFMTEGYSAPINDHRVVVWIYPQLVDLTVLLNPWAGCWGG